MDKRPISCAIVFVVVLLVALLVILLVLRQCEREADEGVDATDSEELSDTEEQIEETLDMLDAVFETYDFGEDVVVNDLFPVNTKEWYAATSDGVYATLDGGATWAQEALPMPVRLTAIGTYKDGAGLVAVGPDGAVLAREPGGDWLPWNTGWAGDFRAVHSWGSHVWCVGDGVAYSPDDGASWMPLFDFAGGAPRYWTDGEVGTDFHGWMVGDGVIARTSDGGFSGDEAFFDNLMLMGVDAPGPGVVFVCGADGTVMKSTDDGADWELLQIETVDDLISVGFLDEKYGVMVSETGRVFSTFDGRTWDERTWDDGGPADWTSASVALFPGEGEDAAPDVVVFGVGGGGLDSLRAPATEIFADGFESGDVSAWSGAVP